MTDTSHTEMLTMEDKRIFLRIPFDASCLYLHSDRADALNMAVREDEKRRSTFSWEAWETNRREWFPSGWGLPTSMRLNPLTEAHHRTDETKVQP